VVVVIVVAAAAADDDALYRLASMEQIKKLLTKTFPMLRFRMHCIANTERFWDVKMGVLL